MSAPPSPAAGSYVLTHIDLYDWGAFGGRHSATIDLAGTAIIGPTGSGKTTLVDALMTLLVAIPRYNLASTGGHESDRDLVSYVRGVSGAGNDGDGNEHIARAGAVVTAIAARFSDGEAVLRIGGLFWLDGSSSAVADLKRRWMFCIGDAPGLDEWLEAHHEGGVRTLKELERRSPGFKVYDTKQAYLSRLRNHFEVGENAFALLNRAAGLKQLNSIDVVFRELVLDDRAAFDSARSVADEFDTLAGIRSELETARKQRDTLTPIALAWTEHQKHTLQLDEQQQLQALLPAWFGQQVVAVWRQRRHDGQTEWDAQQALARAQATRIDTAEATARSLQTAYLQAGGNDIEHLRERIRGQQETVARCGRAADQYQTCARALGLDTALTSDALHANLAALPQRRSEETRRLGEQRQRAWESGARKQALQDRLDALKHEMTQVERRPGSNIPHAYQHFRGLLAGHLGLEESALPFVAELVEVRPDDAAWRGAIERAIGSERLRILIAPEHAAAALDWINVRDNALHVRLHEATPVSGAVPFFDDGFTRKLTFRPHPLREALKRLLAGIDRHCVTDVAALRTTPHAMTVQGLMSGRRGYFDKHDHKPLDREWMTGFDNRDQLARLRDELAAAAGQLRDGEAAFRAEQDIADATAQSLSVLERIGQTVFEDIDVAGATDTLHALRDQLAALIAPESDAAQARRRWESAEHEVRELRQEQQAALTRIGVLEHLLQTADKAIALALTRIGDGLDVAAQALAARYLPAVQTAEPGELETAERDQNERLQKEIARLAVRCNGIGQQLVRDMGKAKAADTGALAETGTELQDIPAYIERLRQLDEEALPEKLTRFREYLNQSSDQGVTQLLSEIDSEVSVIEERIEELNTTLRRVDFQAGRYLQLEPQRVEHESLRTLQRARAHLRSAQLKDDQGESHYRALSELVALLRDAAERRKTLGALALLDPRYRLQFAVLVIERGSGKVIEKRVSSQGGSGGEKEIIASYVLTASLSYALCPQGSERPLFGTIVLDEAFSKSSQAVAGRIILALREFGLHPLFVTPNKELRLLREHTRSAIVVHRRGAQATMTSLSWETLELHARSRAGLQERSREITG